MSGTTWRWKCEQHGDQGEAETEAEAVLMAHAHGFTFQAGCVVAIESRGLTREQARLASAIANLIGDDLGPGPYRPPNDYSGGLVTGLILALGLTIDTPQPGMRDSYLAGVEVLNEFALTVVGEAVVEAFEEVLKGEQA